ncbi:MAG: histidine kinase [Sphingobacteriales bacterium]|nr:MAG: histidine kinase [Sphingobacteriales bacterium]
MFMIRIGKNFVENLWAQEVLVFATLFVLFTLNDWTLITTWRSLWIGLGYFGILYAHALAHRFFVLPYLMERYRPLRYLGLGVGLLLIFGAILSVAKTNLSPDCYLLQNTSNEQNYLFNTATCAISLIAINAPFLLLQFYRQKKAEASSQICINNTELNLLRSQLNPHFLFNTFNNLYGISLHDPARIPDLILQVSQLMRYQLDNICREWVPLKDELTFIENCIALEEERVGCRCNIQYEYKDDRPGCDHNIAPLMLLPFIENAFKHGTNSIEQCYVSILIEVRESMLKLSVRNSIPKKSKAVASTGIGLQNIVQRLQILYPGRHELKRDVSPAEYAVSLSLQLQ